MNKGTTANDMRIAAVQHGDYLAAQRIVDAGEPEPYFAMGYSVRVLRALFQDRPHLVVSLNDEPYIEHRGAGRLVGLPCPWVPRPLPGEFRVARWTAKIIRELEAFGPTHLMLRTGGTMATRIVRWSLKRDVRLLVIFANYLPTVTARQRRRNRELIELLNDKRVLLVGNHKRPATQTLIDAGLRPEKAVAWDWPGVRHPRDYPAKTLGAGPHEVVYVGAMVEAKGLSDLIDAVGLVRRRGTDVCLTAIGDGADLPTFRERARALGDAARFTGRVGNDEVFERMRGAALVCVPSRHEFVEGMPMTLTEALASRTPVIASDHPVIAAAFQAGEGLRYFPAGDAGALAGAIELVLEDAGEYARLSQTTRVAFERTGTDTLFGELLERWKATF